MLVAVENLMVGISNKRQARMLKVADKLKGMMAGSKGGGGGVGGAAVMFKKNAKIGVVGEGEARANDSDKGGSGGEGSGVKVSKALDAISAFIDKHLDNASSVAFPMVFAAIYFTIIPEGEGNKNLLDRCNGVV